MSWWDDFTAVKNVAEPGALPQTRAQRIASEVNAPHTYTPHTPAGHDALKALGALDPPTKD